MGLLLIALSWIALSTGTLLPPERLLAVLANGRPNVTLEEFVAFHSNVVLKRASGLSTGSTSRDIGRSRRATRRGRHVTRRGRQATRDTNEPACASGIDTFNALRGNDTVLRDGPTLHEAAARTFWQYDNGCFVRDCSTKPTSAQTWGFGFLSVIIITLLSFLGVIFIPLGPRVLPYVLPVLVGFGFGAISGDNLFHILPELFAVHDHGAEGSSAAGDPRQWAWLMAVVFASAVLFAIIEMLIYAHFVRRGVQGVGHHAHAPQDDHDGTNVLACDAKSAAAVTVNTKLDLRTITTVGWMNLISDGVHNFVDGLALGAAWSTSLSLGLGTSIAILFHEIPQEIADFSILVRAGFPRRWALVFNLLSGLPSLLGLVIAIPIATAAETAQQWVLAVTSGGFFYIAYTLLVPELLEDSRRRMWTCLSVVLGMVVGFVALLLIAVYEENIVSSFCI